VEEKKEEVREVLNINCVTEKIVMVGGKKTLTHSCPWFLQ